MPSSNVDIVLRAKDEATATLKKLSGSMEGLSGVASRFSTLMSGGALAGAAFAGGALAAVGALTSMATRLADQVEQLENLSASSGIATDKLQVLQFAFKQGGVDATALSQGLSFMTRAIESNAEELAAIGVTSRDTFTAFMQLAKAIASTEDVAQRNALVFKAFGRGGMQLIPVLETLATNYDGLAQAAERTGAALSDSQLRTMRDLDIATDQLSAAITGLSNELVLTFAPAVTTATSMLTELLSVMQAMGREASNEQVKSDMDSWISHMRGERRSRGGGAKDDERWSFWEDQPTYMPGYSTHGAIFGPGNDAGIQQFLRSFLGGEQVGFGMAGGDALGLRGNIIEKLGMEGFADEVPAMLDAAAKEFVKFSDQVRDAFDEIGRHVYSGFYSVLMNLTNKMQTFATATATIWQSIVNGIKSAMAQLISSTITGAFLKLLGLALSAVTGNAAFAMIGAAAAGGGPIDVGSPIVVGGGAGGPIGAETFASSPVGGMANAGASRGGDTFYVTTFSAKDLLTSLVSPRGELRAANSRLIEIAAAS